MNLKEIFSVFSHRHAEEDLNELPTFPESFKNRVVLLLRNRFAKTQKGNYLEEFLEEMHEKLTMLVGNPRLVEDPAPRNNTEDIVGFILTCDTRHFIDFLELTFKSKFHRKAVAGNDNKIVNDINDLFAADNLPYHLTNFTFVTSENGWQSVSAYPKVILKEHNVLHKLATKPALSLLGNEHFKLANSEFLEALDDYRNGDFGDCLTKCGSSFESVMKVICEQNNWEYNNNDPASTLLNIIFDNSDLERFYNDLLMIISTLRNRFSKSHGAGVKEKNPTKNVAQFCINETASAIVFLIQKLY